LQYGAVWETRLRMNPSQNPLDAAPIERPDWPRHADNEYPILACVTLDQNGRHALQHALYLSVTHGHAPLHVANVVADADASGSGSVIERHNNALDLAMADLRAFVKECVGARAEEARLHVRMGKPVETILQLAIDYDIELVVVGAHARTRLERFRFGSVSQGLIETARCPVLVAVPRDFSGMSPTLIPDPPRG
jgi:nucleotide-binding universal stress UspA family protein